MATKTNSQRLAELRKSKTKEEEKASSSTNKSYSNSQRLKSLRLKDAIGFDTLESDLTSMGTTIKGIYDGWQTEETMKNTKSSIENMYNRLTSYQEYRKMNGITDGEEDVNELVDSYKSILDGWDDFSMEYGQYKSADSYNKAIKDSETAKATKEKQKTEDLIPLQTELDELKVGLDVVEQKIKSAPSAAFDLKYEDTVKKQQAYDQELNDLLKLYGFESYEDFKETISEKEAYLNRAKFVQAGYKLTTNATTAENYEEWSQEGMTYSPEDFGDTTTSTAGKSVMVKNDKYRNAAIALEEYQTGTKTDFAFNDVADEKSVEKYRLMTDDEFKTFAYWRKYDKENGTELAYDYIDSIEEDLNIREGQATAEKYKDKSALSKILYGVPAGLDQFASGVENALNFTDDYIPTTSTQYASQGIRRQLYDTGFDLPEWLGGQSFGQVAYDAVNTGANMLPSMAAGAVSEFVLPGSGTYVTAGLMGLSASGNAYQQMLNQGYNKLQSRTYASLVGLSEATLSALLSGMIGGKATSKAIEKVIKGIDNGFLRFAVRWGLEGASEIPEESLQTLIEPMLQNIALGYEKNKLEDTDWSQVAYDGLLGGLSGLGFGGGHSAINTISEQSTWRNTGKGIRENVRVSDTFEIGAMLPQEAEAYETYTRYAEKGINAENVTDVQLGRLYDEADADVKRILTSKTATDEQKVQAIKTLAKLVEAKTENTVAKNKAKLTVGENTQVTSTGASAQIEGIKIDGENTTLVTSEGEVSVDDITLSETDADLVSIAQSMPESTANIFLSTYNSETNGSVGEYAKSFNSVVEMARDNNTEFTMLENRGTLSTSQVQDIYNTTVKAEFEARENAKTELAEKQGKTMYVEGVFDDSVIDYNSKTTDGSKVNWNSLTPTQREAIKFTKLFSKATGVNIKFIKSNVVKGKHKGKNGSYDPATNTIEIDVYAGRIDGKALNDSIIPTLSHELTHWMKDKSPAIYNSIREDVIKTLSENGKYSSDELIAKEMQRMKKAHPDKEVTPEDAIDELVARACEDMLSNSNEARKLLAKMSATEQKGFIEKVKETIDNLIKWVNDLLAHYKSKSAEAETLREYKTMLKKISKQWDAMLVDAIKTNQAMQQEGITDKDLNKNAKEKNTTDEGDVKMSIREEFYAEFDKWVADGRKDTNIRFVVGTTSDVLKSIGMKDQEIILPSGTINQKLKKHTELTVDIVRNIPDLLEHPVIIQFSDAIDPKTNKPKYDSRITLLGELYADMVIDGKKEKKPVLVSMELLPTNQKKTTVLDFSVITSVYGHSKLQQYLNDNSILYIDPNKKRTNKWLSLNRLQLPLGETKYGSIRRITYSGNKVKIQNSNNKTAMEIALEKAGIVDEFGNTKNSDRDVSDYLRIQEMQTELTQINATISEMQQSEGFKAVHDKLSEAIDNGDVENGIKAYKEWQETSGYVELTSKRDTLQAELKTLRDATNKAYERAELEKEQKAIAKSGLSEADYFREQAVKEFGYTPYFYDAGYILPNGKMLNFSGEKGKHYGVRGQDHRAISRIYANVEGSQAMLKFMNEGNVRLMASSPGIDLGIDVEPTISQYNTISRFIREYSKERQFYVDFTDSNGNLIGSLEYDGNISVEEIIYDIKDYFKTGKVREQNKYMYSDRDTLGNTLTKAQQTYFADSKVRDENGNLKVMYHGSPKTDISSFRLNLGGAYFTSDSEYAKAYARGTGKVYEVYLNITKPFDTRNAKDRAIFEKEFYGQWGNGAPLSEKGLPDWTDGDDLIDFLQEKGYDYDGLILDEGGVPTESGVKDRGISYVVFDKANQVKYTDNLNPTANEDMKFSLRENVEETKELIAVHNMRVSELEKSLQLGGLPMPSIAIIKAQSGHSEYGDVSLVFNKNTIDPKLSKDNKVYGGDAWTPTYPTIEYKANEKVAERIWKLYYDIAKKYSYDEARPLYNVAQDLEDELNRHKGEAGLIEYYKDDTRLMNLYLLHSGKGKIETIMKETRTELSEAEIERYDYLINALGEDIINNIKANSGENTMSHRKAYFEENGSKIENAYKQMLSELYGFSEEQVQNVINNTKRLDYVTMIRGAYNYLHNGTVTIKTEEDNVATKDAIRNAASDGYAQWLDDLFKGAEEKSGIRNNVDYFTPSGNRRSFEALHWENNLENVVRVMRSQEETGGGALISGFGIFGVSAKNYKSIADIKADSDRLTHIPEEEYKEIRKGFSARLNEICESIMDKSASNPFIALDNACECVVDAIRVSKTKSGILNNLKQYPQLSVTETTVDDIVALVTDIANMPTEYFEAKPRRAVGFDEVATAIIPDSASTELKTMLNDNGVKFVEYESGNEDARLKALNSLEDVKFSDRDTYAPTFYSYMGKTINEIKQDKIGANSVVSYLKGKGVKNEEIKWSGIETFLEGKKSVTKAELQEFVAGSMLQIEEYESSTLDWDVFSDDGDNYKVRDNTTGKIIDEWTYDEDLEDGLGGYVNRNGEIALTVDEIEETTNQNYKLTRWSDYKLEGGTNYRELTFKLPNSTYSNQAMRTHWGEYAEGILAHARIQDFNTDNGKMLFIEEIQSDWHNEGHTKGYYNKLNPQENKMVENLLEKQKNIFDEMCSTLALAYGEENSQRYEELMEKAKKLREEEKKLETKRKKIEGNTDGIADAPFKETYHEYVLKRLIRMAAEQGYDSIGWTPADVQSKRWSDQFAEGYRIEYDQDIPKFLNKYGKKWGAKVSTTTLNFGGDTIYTDEHGNHPETISEWVAENKDIIALVHGEDAKNRLTVFEKENDLNLMDKETGEVYAVLQVHENGLEVWSMNITDSMKESVLYEGQVMYSDRDTEGNTLTKEQIEFFKDSKMRDENGNLKVMYHGTENVGFTTFDTGFADDGISLFFTDNLKVAKGYSNTYAEYIPDKKLTVAEMTKELGNSYYYVEENNGKYQIIHNKYGDLEVVHSADSYEEMMHHIRDEWSGVQESGNYKVYLNLTNPLIVDADGNSWDEIEFNGKTSTTREISQYAKDNGYDGVIFNNLYDNAVYATSSERFLESTVAVAFNGNQVKSVANTNPTLNPDIRYSDRDNVSVYDLMKENKRLEKENAKFKEDVENLKERLALERQVTHGNYFNKNQLDAVAGHIRGLANSNYDKKGLVTLLDGIYSYIAHSPDLNWQDLYAQCYDVARMVLDEARPTIERNDYAKMILKNIRGTRISANEQQIQNAKYRFGNRWNNAFLNKVKLVDNGTSLDRQWQEWAATYPDVFDAEISDADMLVELYDVYDSLKDTSETVIEYDMEEQTRWLAREIYNQYWNVSPIRTTADKYDKQIKRLNFEHRKAMQELRDRYNESLENRKKDKQMYKDLIRDIRKRNDERIKEVRKAGKERMDAYKERAERKTKIQSITSNSLTLNRWLTKNSKDEHIHEALKGPVINLLQAIDFSSKQLLGMSGTRIDRRGTPTQTDISLSKALSKVKDMMYDASVGKEELVMLYGHDLNDEIKELVDSVDNMMRTVGDNEFVLNKMSLEELQTLDKIVKTIKHAATKMNTFHTVNHAKGIANLSQEEIIYADSLGKTKVFDPQTMKAKVKKLLRWDNAVPYYAFKRFGAAGQKIFEAFQDGWDKLSFHAKEIIDYAENTYTSKELKEWSQDIKSFDILMPTTDADLADPNYKPQYQKVQMTVPQIMSLYCLQKREQAKGHLLGGGIRVADIKRKNGELIQQSEGVVLTEGDIQKIIKSLSKRQIQVADTLQKFMNTVCADWGNEVSMARFGYLAFGDENYFPIQSDKNNLAVEDETEKSNSLFKLLNMSFTKSTIENANNRIVISDIFDVFAQHSSDMAKYNALALPVLDAFRWYNYSEKGKKGDTQFITKSVKQSIENAFGKEGQNYITTFLKDINGQQNVGRDTLGKGFFSNAKIASVAMNLRVALLQPTAFLKAGAIMKNKYLTKAFLHKPKIKHAEKYCGIALWKSLGYYDTDISKGLTEKIKHNETWKDKAVEISMKGAEWGDKITFGYLWNACELEIRDTRKDLKVGSDEFFKAVGKRLREVIYATQVVDSTMTRSQIMRSGNMYEKMLTAFSSEPTLAYNMLQDVKIQGELEKRANGKVSKETIKKFGKVLTAYTITNAMAALIESGFDAFRDDDDDEEMDMAMFMKLYLGNFANDMSVLAKIPYLKEIISIAQGFTSSRSDTQWMQSFSYAIKGVWKMVVEGEGDPVATIKNALRSLSYLSGLPFYNAYRDLMAALDKLDILTAEDIEELFEDFLG